MSLQWLVLGLLVLQVEAFYIPGMPPNQFPPNALTP